MDKLKYCHLMGYKIDKIVKYLNADEKRALELFTKYFKEDFLCE